MQIRPCAALAASLFATCANAEFYVGASGGQARWDECYSDVACDRTDGAWSARAGYMFLPWLGVEARYVDLGRVRSESGFFVGVDTEPVGLSMSARGAGINAVATLPIADRFALSVLGGWARMEMEPKFHTPGNLVIASGFFNEKRTSTEPYYGVRASWSVTPQVDLSLEAERYRLSYSGLEQDASFVGAGVAYRFR